MITLLYPHSPTINRISSYNLQFSHKSYKHVFNISSLISNFYFFLPCLASCFITIYKLQQFCKECNAILNSMHEYVFYLGTIHIKCFIYQLLIFYVCLFPYKIIKNRINSCGYFQWICRSWFDRWSNMILIWCWNLLGNSWIMPNIWAVNFILGLLSISLLHEITWVWNLWENIQQLLTSISWFVLICGQVKVLFIQDGLLIAPPYELIREETKQNSFALFVSFEITWNYIETEDLI